MKYFNFQISEVWVNITHLFGKLYPITTFDLWELRLNLKDFSSLLRDWVNTNQSKYAMRKWSFNQSSIYNNVFLYVHISSVFYCHVLNNSCVYFLIMFSCSTKRIISNYNQLRVEKYCEHFLPIDDLLYNYILLSISYFSFKKTVTCI